jgi:hypothetical protein
VGVIVISLSFSSSFSWKSRIVLSACAPPRAHWLVRRLGNLRLGPLAAAT